MDAKRCDRCGEYYVLNQLHGEIEMAIFTFEDYQNWSENKYWRLCPKCIESTLEFMTNSKKEGKRDKFVEEE